MLDHRAPPNNGGRWTRRRSTFRIHRLHGRISAFPLRRCSPVWLFTLIAVVALTTVNVFISLKLTYTGDKVASWNSSDSDFHPSKMLDHSSDCSIPGSSNASDGFRFLNHSGRLDNSRRYAIHDFAVVGERWSSAVSSSVVCLATQTSVDQMFWLTEVVHAWQGPVSVSVFVPGEDYDVAVRFIGHLVRCFPLIREMVSFHFVYPVAHRPKRMPRLSWTKLECQAWKANLKTLLNSRPRSVSAWRMTLLYPQNHMRNVARKGCPTSFVLLTDVDIIPRWDLCASLRHFLRHPPCERCAFVVPTYEVEESVSPLPRNKSLLVSLVRAKKAQPFHNVVFINNQFATNASKWEMLPEEVAITVAYPVTNFELYYEPFYVARDDVPPHDERFVGYGYTRNTQVYEMFVANYKFLVLNSAFAMHRGLKLKKSKNSWREKQNRANSRQFKKFEKEILARYGYNKNMKS